MSPLVSTNVAFIAGASGLVGQECLNHLLKRYESVTSLVRNPSGRLHPRLIERRIDFNRLDTIEIPPGAHIYSALGTTIKKAGSEAAFRRVDFDYPKMLASRAAAAGGVKFMLVSSVGSDKGSRNFYLRVKGELEEVIAGMPLEAALFFRPSVLIGEREESRPAEAIGAGIARAISFALLGPLRKYRPIPAGTVAEAMVSAAFHEVTGVHIYHYDEMLRLASQ
ncbi:MAG: oxidoreductase [Bryobacteraceae bacterium]